MKARNASVYVFCLPMLLCLVATPAKAAENRSDSARRFVQAFYDWYTPRLLQPGNNKPFSWRERASDFDPALVRALKEDESAQAKVKEEIVGLDFDPFLNSQDPCEHNVAGKVTKQGASYLVEVHDVCEGRETERPYVIAELLRKNERWMFVNFHYPADRSSNNESDLLSVLKTLRLERQKKSK